MAGTFDTGIFDTGIFDNAVSPSSLVGIFDTGIFDRNIYDNILGPLRADATGGWGFLNDLNPPSRRRDDEEDEAPKSAKRKRKRLKAETIELAPDLHVQTGIVEVAPAWDAMAELDRIQREVEAVRKARFRAIAMADDDWLMMN